MWSCNLQYKLYAVNIRKHSGLTLCSRRQQLAFAFSIVWQSVLVCCKAAHLRSWETEINGFYFKTPAVSRQPRYANTWSGTLSLVAFIPKSLLWPWKIILEHMWVDVLCPWVVWWDEKKLSSLSFYKSPLLGERSAHSVWAWRGCCHTFSPLLLVLFQKYSHKSHHTVAIPTLTQ